MGDGGIGQPDLIMANLDYASLKLAGEHYRFVTYLAISAFTIGLALDFNNGEYFVGSLALVTIALILVATAIIAWQVGTAIQLERTLFITVGLEMIALLVRSPSADLTLTHRWQMLPFYACIVAAGAVICLAGMIDSRPWQRLWFPILLSLHLMASIWILRQSPAPKVDVWVFQQDGSRELLQGRNPYEMTFPDIYHSTLPGHQLVYGPNLVVNDRVQFGFPYPPVSLLLVTAGYAVAHDHRYAQAFALMLAGALAGYCHPGRFAKLAAALLLFTPREFFVLGRGWTEPFTVMFLAATLFLAVRRSRFLPLALGLFIVTKQYLILAVPLTFCLLPAGWRWRDWLWLLIKTAIVGAVVTLPLALWNFYAYWRSTVTVQELAPFRWDALSYLVWFGFRGHLVTDPSTAVIASTLAAMVTLALAIWATPRTPAGFAAGVSFVALAFFAFNKQAFCNYYFFVIGAMCCAAAATQWITGKKPNEA
jgi:hypothetical protein